LEKFVKRRSVTEREAVHPASASLLLLQQCHGQRDADHA